MAVELACGSSKELSGCGVTAAAEPLVKGRPVWFVVVALEGVTEPGYGALLFAAGRWDLGPKVEDGDLRLCCWSPLGGWVCNCI